jgi:uncharacterized membrane protein
MGSPTLTVTVLVVLWLIVVVPMILQRKDAGEQERSVRRFGMSMRALSRRGAVAGEPLARATDPEDATFVRPHTAWSRDEVFVTGSPERPASRRASARSATRPGETRTGSVAVRRPIPAAQEALMYPIDRSEMSAARRQMMARRRRSLTILGGGSFLMLLLTLVVGGGLFVAGTVLFLIGLAGYVLFLRSQAQRDRERREHRQERQVTRTTRSYDVTEREEFFAEPPASVVRIDDDDIRLHNLDTVDLTGLYNEESATVPAVQRRAS